MWSHWLLHIHVKVSTKFRFGSKNDVKSLSTRYDLTNAQKLIELPALHQPGLSTCHETPPNRPFRSSLSHRGPEAHHLKIRVQRDSPLFFRRGVILREEGILPLQTAPRSKPRSSH